MAIRAFIYTLLGLTLISFFFSANTEQANIKVKDKPGLVFDDSIMYTLTSEGMSRIVISKKAERYKTKDMMYDGKIITESKDGNYTDYISADLMVKRGEKFKFINNAKYNRENFIELNSDEILYDAKTRIATNTMPFTGRYYDHTIKGTHLYFNTFESIMRANNAHFEVFTQTIK